jgi:hypothetical protein
MPNDEKPWSRADTAKLLAIIATYDDRNFGDESHMLSWTTAGEYGRWELILALEAVHRHHLNSTELIKPAHVNAFVQSAKQDRAMRVAPAPVTPITGGGKVEKFIQRNWRSEAEMELSLLEIECPFEGCRAPKSQPCMFGGYLAGRRKRHMPHPGRHIALAEHARSLGMDPSYDGPDCPTCGAPEGLRCMNLGRGAYLSGNNHPHPLRLGDAA